MKPTSWSTFALFLAVLCTKRTDAALCDNRFLAPVLESQAQSKSLQDLTNAKDDINDIKTNEHHASLLRSSFLSWSCLCLLALPLAAPFMCMLASRMGEEMSLKDMPKYILDEETATLRRVNRKPIHDADGSDSEPEGTELPAWW